jgi:hypothetical protein
MSGGRYSGGAPMSFTRLPTKRRGRRWKLQREDEEAAKKSGPVRTYRLTAEELKQRFG